MPGSHLNHHPGQDENPCRAQLPRAREAFGETRPLSRKLHLVLKKQALLKDLSAFVFCSQIHRKATSEKSNIVYIYMYILYIRPWRLKRGNKHFSSILS